MDAHGHDDLRAFTALENASAGAALDLITSTRGRFLLGRREAYGGGPRKGVKGSWPDYSPRVGPTGNLYFVEFLT